MVKAYETKDTHVSVAGPDFRVNLNTQIPGFELSMPINVDDFTELQSSGIGKVGLNVQTEVTATMRVGSDWLVLREKRNADDVWAFVHLGAGEAQGATAFWQANVSGSGMDNPTGGFATSSLSIAQNGIAYAMPANGATYFDLTSSNASQTLPDFPANAVVVVELTEADTNAADNVTVTVTGGDAINVNSGPSAHSAGTVSAGGSKSIALANGGTAKGWVHIGVPLDVD